MDLLEHAPLTVGRWIVQRVPEAWQPVAGALLGAAVLVGVFAGLFALTTWLER